MNYERIYESLIELRRQHPISRKDCYCERHHFIPRCMGGGNEKWNLVYLTGKEHFVAHHLLCKCNPSNGKLLNAFIAMCTKSDRQVGREIHISARRYEALKTAYGELRRKMSAGMTDEERERRCASIKAGCAKRTAEQKAAIKAKREKYFASLTDAERAQITAKYRATLASRSEGRKREVFEIVSKAHRKMSEEDELRVVAEYGKGRTAAQIAAEPWCQLGREGVNCLLRRRGVQSHIAAMWIEKENAICADFTSGKYVTRTKLAEAYSTSWAVIERILLKNGIAVKKRNAYSRASYERESARLSSQYVEYAAPFSRTVRRSSLYAAIEQLHVFGLVPCGITRRIILKKIRSVLAGNVKYAYGYTWRRVDAVV